MKRLKESTTHLPYLTEEYFQKYIRKDVNIGVDSSRINLEFLCDNERSILKTPVNGDSSLVLRYKGKEGGVLSVETLDEEISILQIQGAKTSVSYKVSTGIIWPNLMGDQLVEIATNEKSGIRLLSMPRVEKIAGLYDGGNEAAIKRYEYFAHILGLKYSKENDKFLREIRVIKSR